MPTRGQYFFIVQSPSQTFSDDAGTWFRNINAALAHADAIIDDLKSEGDYDYRDWLMIVQKPLGHTVYSIPFYAGQGGLELLRRA